MTEAEITAALATENARLTTLKAAFDAMATSSTAGMDRQVEENRIDDSSKFETLRKAIQDTEKKISELNVELAKVPREYVTEFFE